MNNFLETKLYSESLNQQYLKAHYITFNQLPHPLHSRVLFNKIIFDLKVGLTRVPVPFETKYKKEWFQLQQVRYFATTYFKIINILRP